MQKSILSFEEVNYLCREFRSFYLGLCQRDINSRLALAITYRRSIDEKICSMLSSFAEAAGELNSIYRECLFLFSASEWHFYNIEGFLSYGLKNPFNTTNQYDRKAEYILSVLGEEKVRRYTYCYANYIKIQKSTQQKMIRFTLEQSDMPVILYEEVLEYAKRKLEKNKNNESLRLAIEEVEYQNHLYAVRGVAGCPTIGNYYFK